MMRLSMLLLCLSLLGGCLATEKHTGYQLREEQLEKVKIGQSTRDDVLQTLGTPSSWTSFGDQRWLYIGNRLIQKSVLDPELEAQRVIAITFNEAGVVKDIEEKNEHDAKFVSMNSRTTPTEGHDLSAMEQIVGNFGRFNKGSNMPDVAEQ